MGTLLGASAVAFGASFVFLAQANGADTDRQDYIRAHGGDPSRGRDSAGCRTPAECAELRSLAQDRDDARDRWAVAMAAGTFVGVASLAVIMLWPNAAVEPSTPRASLAPSVDRNGAGARVEVRF